MPRRFIHLASALGRVHARDSRGDGQARLISSGPDGLQGRARGAERRAKPIPEKPYGQTLRLAQNGISRGA